MSQLVKYQTPIFAWPLSGQDAPYTITFEATGAAGTFGSPYVYTWTGWQTGQPVFPYLAQDLEEQLNLNTDDVSTWRARWVFESGQVWSNLVATDGYATSPKLVLSNDNADGYTSGAIIITPSSPLGVLSVDYIPTVGDNWIGATGAITINFGSDFGSRDPWAQFPLSPHGVWNPAVLQYGDSRSRTRSVGQSTNSFSLQKSVSLWGEHYRREIFLPLVRATNLYAYRRVNPLFEENAVQRTNPNNLYEAMIKDQTRNIPLEVFTEVPPDVSEGNSTTYFSAFRSRLCKMLDSAVLTDDGGTWSFQAEDQRMANVTIVLHELPDAVNSGY